MNIFSVISAICGFALVSAGFAMVYRPLGIVVAGTLLLGAAFMSARRRK